MAPRQIGRRILRAISVIAMEDMKERRDEVIQQPSLRAWQMFD